MPCREAPKGTGRTRYSRWLLGCPLNGSDRVIPKRLPCCRRAAWPSATPGTRDGWGGFSPGSEGLSLASGGLGRPWGTPRHGSRIRKPWPALPRQGHSGFEMATARLSTGYATSSPRAQPRKGPHKVTGVRARPLLRQESRERNPSAAGMLWRQQLLLGFRCPLSSHRG